MGDHFNSSDEGKNICMILYNKNISFIVEEKLIGEEFSLISITDGINISHCPPVQDYKEHMIIILVQILVVWEQY